jgi:hypothetical protein
MMVKTMAERIGVKGKRTGLIEGIVKVYVGLKSKLPRQIVHGECLVVRSDNSDVSELTLGGVHPTSLPEEVG